MNVTIEFTAIDCPRCGLAFAITKEYEARRRADHACFQCPSGHSQHWPGQTEEERLRKLASERRNRIDALESANADLLRRLSRKRKS